MVKHHYYCHLLIALLLLSTTVNANIFKSFNHYWNTSCFKGLTKCPKKLDANTFKGTDQGSCAIASWNDVKESDSRYSFGATESFGAVSMLPTEGPNGFQREIQTYQSSPDSLYVYKAAVDMGGNVYLRNQPMETHTDWKHFIYLLELKSPKGPLKLAFWLDGEGFCNYQIPGYDNNTSKFAIGDPFISATLVWIH
jgi:hypothetical protein